MSSDLTGRILAIKRSLNKSDGLIARPVNLISPFLSLPGLVGFWPMSSIQRSTGDVYDLSNQNRTLTYNGNPTFNIYNNSVAYIDLDGTGDYLSRADETDLDIQANESQVASAVQGAAWGGWFYPTVASGYAYSKGTSTITDRTFEEQLASGPDRRLSTCHQPGNITTNSINITLNTWQFWAAVYKSGDYFRSFHNGAITSQSTVTTSLVNSTGPLQIGARDGSSLYTGRACLCFLSANAVPDEKISMIYELTRGAFGV